MTNITALGYIQRVFDAITNNNRNLSFGGSAVTTESLYAMIVNMTNGEGKLMAVSPESAQNLSTVNACVKIITDTFSLLEPQIKYRDEKGIFIDPKHDQNTLLQRGPNRIQNAINFRIDLLADYCYYGHGYAKLVKNSFGRAFEYKYLPFNTVQRIYDKENLLIGYYYTNGGVTEYITIEDMIDISDVYGKSRIMSNAKMLQEYEAVRSYSRDSFKNGTYVSGFIFGDKPLSTEQGDNLLKSWTNRTQKGEPGILPHGYKYQALTQNIPMADAGIAMAKNNTSRDICAMMGVPASLVFLDNTADNKGDTDFNTFVSTTIAPICKLVEVEFSRKIFRPKESNYYLDHNVRGLYRMSLKEKFESYKTAIYAGMMNPDEALMLEGLNPTADGSGKTYMKPANMMPSSVWESYFLTNKNGQNAKTSNEPGAESNN